MSFGKVVRNATDKVLNYGIRVKYECQNFTKLEIIKFHFIILFIFRKCEVEVGKVKQ